MAPGAPLPDLEQLAFCPAEGQELSFIGFSGHARGPLREAFGVPEGSLGFVQTRQTGLLGTWWRANANSRVAFDAFPAEQIVLKALKE